jgi:hypothetical protein
MVGIHGQVSYQSIYAQKIPSTSTGALQTRLATIQRGNREGRFSWLFTYAWVLP